MVKKNLGQIKFQEGGIRLSLALIACGVLAFLIQTLFLSGTPVGRALYFASVVAPCILGAIWGICAGTRVMQSHGRESLGWILFGIGTGCCAIGEFTYNLPELLGASGPNESKWIDVLFVMSYLFQASAFLTLSKTKSMRQRIRVSLDSATVAIAGAFFLWTFLLKKTWSDPQISQLDRSFAILYPICGLFAVWAALKYFTEEQLLGRSTKNVLIMLVGMTAYVGSDIYWAYLEANSIYSSGNFGDAGWPIGYGLIALGAMYAFKSFGQESQLDADDRQKKGSTVLGNLIPGLALATTIIVACGDYQSNHGISILSLIALVSMSILISARQILTIHESQDALKEANLTLERRIRERTNELEERVAMVVRITNSETLDEAGEIAVFALKNLFNTTACGVHIESLDGASKPFGSLFWLGDYQGSFRRFSDQPDFHPNTKDQFGFDFVEVMPDGKEISFACVPLYGSSGYFGSITLACDGYSVRSRDIDRLESIAIDMGSGLGQLILALQTVASSELDYLTNLLNHRSISRRFHKFCETAQDSQKALGIVCVDLMDFRKFNDTYGHAVGDELLRKVGTELRRSLGTASPVGRTGADEFMVLVPGANLRETYQVAKIIQETISSIHLCPPGHTEEIPIGMHIGLASYPESGSNPYMVLTKAEANLAEARIMNTPLGEQNTENLDSKKHLADDAIELIEMFVTAIDNMDSYTRRHSEDVMKYSIWIGEELECSPDLLQTIATAALLHDIGKIAVPSSILRKPAALTSEEQLVVQQHPYIGSLIVQALPGMSDCVPGVLGHHERFDGKGYPNGLAGENIPYVARLLAVADAYSAMTTDRPYRKGMDSSIAAGRIEEGIGTHFCPEMAKAMIVALKKRGLYSPKGEAGEDAA